MENLISLKEASKILDLHPNSLRTKVKERKIKHFRIGKNIKFKRQHLDEFLESKIINPIYFEKGSLLSFDDYYRLQSGGKNSTVSKNSKVLNLGHGKVIERTTPKLKKKTWKIRYENEEGNLKQETVKGAQSMDDGVIALSEKVKEIFYRRLGLQQPNKKVGITLKEFSKKFLEKHSKKKKSYPAHVNRIGFILKFFKEELKKPNIQLEEIDSEMIMDYQSWKPKQNGCKPITVNRDLEVFRKLLNSAEEWGYIERAPKVNMMAFEKNNIMRELKEGDEESKLFAEAEASGARYLSKMIEFALETGMRLGEILKLKWQQIDFDHMLVHVINTKSAKDRFIPITERLYEILNELKKQQRKNGFVFENPETGDRYKCISRAYNTARKRAGLEDLRFHDLRHTFAMRFLRNGGNIYTLSKILGHESVNTTQKFYLKTDVHEAQFVMDLMSKNRKPIYKTETKNIAYA